MCLSPSGIGRCRPACGSATAAATAAAPGQHMVSHWLSHGMPSRCAYAIARAQAGQPTAVQTDQCSQIKQQNCSVPFTRGTAAFLTTVKGNDMATILRIAAAPGTEATDNTAAGYAISVSHNAAAMLQPPYVVFVACHAQQPAAMQLLPSPWQVIKPQYSCRSCSQASQSSAA